jgi:hypothetical protein
MEESELLSNAQAATFLGVRPQTLRAWRHRGGGPCYHRVGVGRRAKVAYSAGELRSWLQARRFTSTAEESARAAEAARLGGKGR